jgi:outer membrane protein OmpA-like peptidoglycan-associated protein
MKAFRSTWAAALLICAATSAAYAQSDISPGEILKSLTGGGQAAKAAGIDIAAARAEIQNRIKNERGENAADPPPILQGLATLPNLTLLIDFDFDSDRIKPSSYHTLARIADALHHPLLMSYAFVVVGHTDAAGSRQYNFALSERRVAAVIEALTTTFRVDPAQLVGLGVGEEQLRDPAKPEDAGNRRVQFINLGPR